MRKSCRSTSLIYSSRLYSSKTMNENTGLDNNLKISAQFRLGLLLRSEERSEAPCIQGGFTCPSNNKSVQLDQTLPVSLLCFMLRKKIHQSAGEASLAPGRRL